jgi:adenylyltransferase/sulfurtransferase
VPNCAEAGVFGALPGIVGTIQAVEVIKLVLDLGDPLIGRLLIFDALAMEFSEVNIRRDPKCPVCGDNPSIRELIDYEQFCGVAPPVAEPETIGAGV